MERRELERLQYWQEQKLRSKDFNDQAQIEAQLRWWHNRSLHAIPGVVEGLEVRLEGGSVIIGTGMAYDGFGRELIHGKETTLPVPDPLPAEGLILLAHLRLEYQQSKGAREACLPFTSDPAVRQLEFTWLRVGETGVYGGVRLGRLYRQSDEVLQFEEERRFARPWARPRVASGSTIPGNTDWQPWTLGDNGHLIGLQVRVDTSAAGFTQIPCNFAWLQAADWTGGEDPLLILAGFQIFEHIDEVTVNGFTFRLLFPSFRLLFPILDIGRKGQRGGLFQFLQKVKPYVCWIGIG
jgi:hypothetical protein